MSIKAMLKPDTIFKIVISKLWILWVASFLLFIVSSKKIMKNFGVGEVQAQRCIAKRSLLSMVKILIGQYLQMMLKRDLAKMVSKLLDFISVIPILPIAVFTLMSNKSEALMTQFMQS